MFVCLWARAHLATLFSHRWPRFFGGPEHTRATCGGEWQVSYPTEGRATCGKFPTLLSGCHMQHEQSLVCSLPNAERSHKTLCLWRGRATACRTLEPQTAVCSPKLENNGFLRE